MQGGGSLGLRDRQIDGTRDSMDSGKRLRHIYVTEICCTRIRKTCFGIGNFMTSGLMN